MRSTEVTNSRSAEMTRMRPTEVTGMKSTVEVGKRSTVGTESLAFGLVTSGSCTKSSKVRQATHIGYRRGSSGSWNCKFMAKIETFKAASAI